MPFLQYTMNEDGSAVLHVRQMPPNAALFPPGTAFMFVVVNGVPSNASMVMIGNGQIGTQPIATDAQLPGTTVIQQKSSSGSSSSSGTSSKSGSDAGSNTNKSGSTRVTLGSAWAALAAVLAAGIMLVA